MDWRELLAAVSGGTVHFMTAATNGLKPDAGDKILAVALASLDLAAGDARRTFLVRRCTRDELLKAQEFHGLTEAQMASEGLEDGVFRARLREMFGDGKCALCYNPSFHNAFLAEDGISGARLLDITRLAVLCDSRIAVPEHMHSWEDLLDQLIRNRIQSVAVRKILSGRYGIQTERPGELPCLAMLDALQELFAKMAALPATLLPSSQWEER